MNELQKIEPQDKAPIEMKREVISTVDMAIFFSRVIELFTTNMGKVMVSSLGAKDDMDDSNTAK